jgi:thiol-disulfide isomerase/thioredoxin
LCGPICSNQKAIFIFSFGGWYVQTHSSGPSLLDNLENLKKPKSVTLESQGVAPEFAGISNWLNSKPLTMQELRGKVVLVDFWTYSCINCIRTLPYITKLDEDYRDKGLVIVGVHTPEFPFEAVKENVETALKRYNIKYPVAQDNSFTTWNAYSNRYWPAKYLVDQNGNVVYTHFGEGSYEETENAIRTLLGLDLTKKDIAPAVAGRVGSPEMYFGLSRLENLTPEQQALSIPQKYTLPESLKLNNFGLYGTWEFKNDKAILSGGPGKIRLKFYSGKIFMVASSAKETTLQITVDGKAQPDVLVGDSQLYTLFDSTDYSEHVIDITIQDGGFEAFTFTFG